MISASYYGCPTGWFLSGERQCYLLQDELLSWDDAEAGCVQRGAELVSILSYAEQSEVFALINNIPECPSGFVLDGIYCIKAKKEKLSWYDAQKKCQGMDANLFKVNNRADNELVKRHLDDKVKSTWLGATDEETEGLWQWYDGSNLTFTDWGNPSNTNAENCLLLAADLKWDDRNCTEKHSYICARPQGADRSGRWIGLSDKNSLQYFEWSDSNPVVYTSWGTGFPSTSGGNPVCGYIDNSYGGWKHAECSNTKVIDQNIPLLEFFATPFDLYDKGA